MHKHIVLYKAKIIISIKKTIFHKQNVPQEPLDWIAAEHVQINITDDYVKRNVIVHWDNIATLDLVAYIVLLTSYVGKTVIVHRRNIATRDTVVWNVLLETLDWIAARPVHQIITDGFVWRNVIVQRVNIATLKKAVWNAL